MDIEVTDHIFDVATGFPKGQRGIYALWRNMANCWPLPAGASGPSRDLTVDQ